MKIVKTPSITMAAIYEKAAISSAVHFSEIFPHSRSFWLSLPSWSLISSSLYFSESFSLSMFVGFRVIDRAYRIEDSKISCHKSVAKILIKIIEKLIQYSPSPLRQLDSHEVV